MNLSKSKLNIYSSLGNTKMRRKHSLFIVEGEKSVRDTFGRFDAEAVLVADSYDFQFDAGDVPVYKITEQELKKISSLSTPASVMAVYRIPNAAAEVPKLSNDEFCVALDGIQDPGNLGTIIRTCHWFGIKRIFASHTTVDLYNPKTVQSTMGSLGRVEVVYCDLEDLIDENPGITVYGTLLDGQDIYNADLERRGLLVMGNEGNGISEAVRKKITAPLLIPPADPSNHPESLNVAIATAVTLVLFHD